MSNKIFFGGFHIQ